MPIQLPDRMFAAPEIEPAPPPVDPMVAREQQIADTTRAEQGLNRFLAAKQNLLFEAPDAFYRQQGEDAIHAAPVATQKLDELRRDLLDRLGNDAQRDRLRNALDAQMELARDGMSRHVAEQSHAWQRQVAQDRIALLTKEAALHHNDDGLIDAIGHAAATAARVHARVGDELEQQAKEAAAATARSGVLGAAIQARLDRGDIKGANALFTQVQDQLDPEHAAPMQGQIDAGLMRVLPYRPSLDDRDIKAVPLPNRPSIDGTLDEALMLKNLINVPGGESTPDQNNGGIVPVNATPNDTIDAAKADPQLAQAPDGGGQKRPESFLPLIPPARYSSPVNPDALRRRGRGVAHNSEPAPGSPEYESAMNIAVGRPVYLSDGSTIPDATSPTGKVMSPASDLGEVAAAGRKAGEDYRAALANPGTAENAIVSLATNLGLALGHGGTFDHQRGPGNSITGFQQRPQFRNISNINVGLYGQQAGLSREELLTIASVKSSNSNSKELYGLDPQTRQFIELGYEIGASGKFNKNPP